MPLSTLFTVQNLVLFVILVKLYIEHHGLNSGASLAFKKETPYLLDVTVCDRKDKTLSQMSTS